MFNSCKDCKKHDKEIFNQNFNAGILLKHIRNNKKYKNYNFKFVSSLTEEEYIKYNVEYQLKNILNCKLENLNNLKNIK